MSVDDDDIREAERLAAEYVAWQAKQERIREAASDLCNTVWPHLLSSATANLIGQPDDADDAAERAWPLLNAVDDVELLRQAIVCALWQYAKEVAEADLKQLRDFHYVDDRAGLTPLPPAGRHRASEDVT